MIRRKLKQIGSIAALSSALLFTNCAADSQDFAAGVAVGAILGTTLGVYDSPRYYDQPYYYHGGRYYYGGVYRDGYYIYNGKRFRNGHYYNHGYRYYKGHRYSPRVGNYGYYRSNKEYKYHHRPKPHHNLRHKEYKRDKKYEKYEKHNNHHR